MTYKHFKHSCKQVLAAVVRPLGFVPTQSPQAATDLLSQGLATLRNLGFDPKHIVDIGANRGGWTRTAIKYFPNAEFTVVEPQEWLKAEAQDVIMRDNVHWHTAGISNQSATMMLTLYDRDDSSSFRHSSNDASQLGLKQISVPVYTLEELLSDNELPIPDAIKIDAEGLDLAVLEGAKQFLGNTEVFFLEAGIAQKQFENSISTVIATMHAYGYRVFDITDLNRTQISRTLWLVELIFVRIGGKLDLAVQTHEA